MANNRIYIRCKGCGATLFLGKTFACGYYWENYYGKGVHLEDQLNSFFDTHNYCVESKVEPPVPYDTFLFPLAEDCGGKEMRIEKHVYFNFPSTYGVKCLTCRASTSQFYSCEEIAVDAWNRRANDEQIH